ncbi:hypothetical protein V0R37_03325 [Pollutimonas sp. H1-120]|uniref:hypothetical protein n=1 Tax=Pollutimonas sp. H1-120 TaxID=3148824 RepID=UPI003B528EA2
MALKIQDEGVQAKLERLGIAVPEEDLPFLQRAFNRQRELLRRQSTQLSPESEPAHVFRPSP